MFLKEFRSKAKGLPDLLIYVALVDNGIVLQKDGSFMAGYEYSGIDTASATYDELEFLSVQVSNALKLLGTGFMLHTDAIRTFKKAYPSKEKSFYTDKVTKIIDDERRAFFGADVCFENSCRFVLTYKPEYLITNTAKKEDVYVEKSLEFFKKSLIAFEDSLSAVLHLARLEEYEMNDFVHSDLLAHLEQCITGTFKPFRVPKTPMYLDALIGSEDLLGGLEPMIGNKHIMILAIDGFPAESYPTILSELSSIHCEYRFSTRFILLDQYDAEREINTYVKGWNQKIFSFLDQLQEKQHSTTKINRDALFMKEDAESAKLSVQSGAVGAGFMTSNIILMNADKTLLDENVREIRKLLQTYGFSCRIETINSLEAYLGSLPGNSYSNVRRPLMTTMNLADFLPLSTIYTGSSVCPSPFFPPASRPLAVLTTELGSTPFWLNLHVNDLGHTLIFGPTGSGKSTLLSLLVAQFKLYKNAQIFAFDKGMSLFPLCKGANGLHFEIGVDELSFCPLQEVDESPSELAFCEQWIETLLELQGLKVLPAHRNTIHEAMLKLRDNAKDLRSLTTFCHAVQDKEIVEALKHFTIAGAMGNLLDAEHDSLHLSDFVVFELEELMNKGDKNLIPVLLYIFHRIEKSLNGQPTLLVLDEAWLMLSHKEFRDTIYEWQKYCVKRIVL